ncbi:MAG TPA: SAM-dependent chlorinase/fluorinase [Candidatus Saccharimonadales bacterium]|nr:SAM-dependent chlorinase/fluorinase [Candidatus Saccharimonadales bacterium]
MADRPFISFMTDFGVGSSAPSVCRGVIYGIAREAVLVDITHAIRQFAIRDGAFLLSRSVPYFPIGTHVAVVDPGVGTLRRPIALRAQRGDLFVGPDNGLLVPAAEKLGGIAEARALENEALWLSPVSHTFHGRDIFSPVAAHLAMGTPFESVGSVLGRDQIVDLALPRSAIRDHGLDTAVLFIDAFGNCRLAGEMHEVARLAEGHPRGLAFDLVLPDRGERPAERVEAVRWVATFGDVSLGSPLLFEDADYAGPALAINQGSAAEHFALTLDTAVRLEPT